MSVSRSTTRSSERRNPHGAPAGLKARRPPGGGLRDKRGPGKPGPLVSLAVSSTGSWWLMNIDSKPKFY